MVQETLSNESAIASPGGSLPGGPRRAPEDAEIDLLEFAKVLKQNKFLIFKFALGAAILTAIVVSIMRPYYRGEASFLPPNSMSSSGSSMLLGQLGSLGGATGLGPLKDPTSIYVGILKSRTVADDIINRLDLAKVYKTVKLSQTEHALNRHTSIVAGKDSIVTISVDDSDPKRAADLANAYLSALHNLSDRIALTEAGQKRLFFEHQLEKEKNSLADAEVDLARTQQITGLIQPIGQEQLQLETITQMQVQIATREVELAAMSQGATEQNPEVVRLRSEIEGLRAQLAKLQNSPAKPGAGNVQIPTAKVPELTLSYVRKARDVKYHEALYELLLRQYESAKLDEARSAPLMQVVDYAVVPDTKAGPARTLLTLGALVLGAFLGIAWVFIKYAMKSLPAGTRENEA